MKCPECGNELDEDNYCSNCGEFMKHLKCPECGNELDEDNYCDVCCEFMDSSSEEDDSDSFYEDPDYDSMVNNGEEICLNCTYWSVSPYGSAHGMVCRRGNGQTEPDDTCFDFVKASHFSSYGDSGQYQFNETDREISNKLYHWKNSR